MAITFVTSRSDLTTPRDTINWEQYPFWVINMPSPGDPGNHESQTSGGRDFFVDNPGRSLITQQGNATPQSPPWAGSFPNSEFLLYTWKSVGPIRIGFHEPVRGVGAQIQEKFGTGDPVGANFTAIIRVLDRNRKPLKLPGLKPGEIPAISNDGTGSLKAPFVGALSEDASIWFAEFDTCALDNDDRDKDFAIGRVTIAV
jgi:hypothetical protein